MPKKDLEYNNPFDKNAPRTKKLTFKVNEYDIYDFKFNARREGMQGASFFRYRCDLVDAPRGAKAGNTNSKKKGE